MPMTLKLRNSPGGVPSRAVRASKWLSLAVVAVCALVALGLTLSYRNKKRTQEAEIAQADKFKAMAEAKAAGEKRQAREKELEAAKQKAANIKAEEELKEKEKAAEDAKAEAENAKRLRAEEENKVAQANLKAAEENRKAKEAEKAALELALDLAGATNETMRVQLELAAAQRDAAEKAEAANAAALKTQELLKAEYDRLLEEQREINKILREREEETRPDRTMAMLVAENEERRRLEMGEDWVPDYEYTEQPVYTLHEGPATGFRKPTANDARLAALSAEKDREVEEKAALARKRIVRELEGLVRQALGEGRKEEAESYYESLLSLVPDYEPPSAK